MLITLQQLKSALQAVKSYITSVVPTKVSDLTDDSGHYTKPSGGIPASDMANGVIPAVDNTLTVAGAAADAKKTGDEFSSLKEDFVTELSKNGLYVYVEKVFGEYVDSDGTFKPYSATPKHSRSTYIDLENFVKLIVTSTSNGGYYCFYNANKEKVGSRGSFLVNKTYEIAIPNDARYFAFSTLDSAFAGTLIQGYTLQYYNEIERQINDINSNFVETPAEFIAVNNGNNYFDYNWIKDHKYKVTNTGEKAIAITTCTSQNVDVEEVVHSLAVGAWIEYTITQNASKMRVYSVGAGGKFTILDEDTVIAKLNRAVINNKSDRPQSGYENFSVSVNYADYTLNDEETPATYTDYGVIALPSTYDKAGEPTPLIILCGGTGERIGANTNPSSFNGWEYFLAKGYAVMDMNGMSSAWGNAESFPVTNQHYCNKYLLSSYAKGYEYVTEKYNLKKRIFVAGISMGGGAASLIVQSNILPVIANVLFCPALSVYKQDYMNPWNATPKNQQKTIAGQWGFTNWSSAIPSQSYFLENIDKVKGFDNLLIRTFGDHATANAHYGDEAEASAYNAMSKSYPVPLKIWHCENDTTVLFRYSQFMVNMIKNGGGQAWLRSFATGGHTGGWDTGSVTDAGVTTSIPFYEAILFLEQFS